MRPNQVPIFLRKVAVVSGAHAAPTARGSMTSVSNSTHPTTVSKPTGVLAANKSVIFCLQVSDQTPLLITGFTSINTATSAFVGNHYLYSYRVVDDSELSTFSTDTVSGTGTQATIMWAYDGVDTVTPQEAWSTSSATNTTSFVAPSATSTTNNALFQAIYFDDIQASNTINTPPAGMTSAGLTAGLGMGTCTVYYSTVAVAGASGTGTLVWGTASWGMQTGMIVRSATP